MKLIMLCWFALGLALLQTPAQAETQRDVIDDGYEFMDGGRPIKATERDGRYTEIPFTNPNVSTPCAGMNLPMNKTRNARVEGRLSCHGSFNINQVRRSEAFDKKQGFKEVLDSGDEWALFEFMRKNSQTTWNYRLGYTTNVNWVWTKHLKGKNGSQCGYRYEATTCTRTTRVSTRTCTYVPDPPSNGGGGGSGGGFSPGGGGGGGGGYENTNPFGFNIIELVIPKAHAGYECSPWTSHNEYDTFTCYNRYVKHCEWTEETPESMVCSNEHMPVTVELVKKPEGQWNPSQPDYVPFVPNGNDLLPGEAEVIQMQVEVAGQGVRHSTPKISGGEDGSHASYYAYQHEVRDSGFQCVQNATNTFKWEAYSKDRQVSTTPNSLQMAQFSTGDSSDYKDELQRTGLFDAKGQSLVSNQGGHLAIAQLPEVLTMLDTSAQRLGTVTSAFRRSDRRDGDANNEVGTTVTRGQTTAGQDQKFWKDTFYRVQLYEVFPGRSKSPIRVTEMLIQSDSLVKRVGNLVSLPLAGQYSDTESAYDLSSSGVIIPKGYFRTVGEEYVMIPGQTYELRLSMLHRGIPFYHSGCSGNAVSCEREAPNVEAFSNEKVLSFVYEGEEQRGFLRRYYDFMRRVSPW